MIARAVVTVLAALCLTPAAVRAQERLDPNNLPKKVADALKARFPKAEVHQATREQEGDTVLYDLEFTQEGRKFEADILEDGRIDNWEQQISAADLPAAVTRAVERRYARSSLKEIMAITVVKGATEALEAYEIVLQTAEGKDVEVTVAPDGTIMEDAGTEKP
jgi:hypothetical protein